MPANDGKPLSGHCVWVTRPQHQSLPITKALHQLGADVLQLPLLDLREYTDPASQARLASAAGYHVVIFVSANAVHYSAAHHASISNCSEIAVIGRATADKCSEHGINVQYVPEQADSDGLLALPRFQALAAQRVLIVRGQAGRAYLGDQLEARGAVVDYAEVYQRCVPQIALSVEQARADFILVTSGEALANLAMLARRDQQDWVFGRQLVLIHERIAGRASELGFTLKPLIARQASDTAMIAAILERV